MLRPQDNARREAKRLDGLWDFTVDTNGVGREQRWWQRRLTNPIPMPVPSSYNDVLVDPAVHDHVGDVWYQRTVFRAPRLEGQSGRPPVRRGNTPRRVWVGDEHVVSHEGGYTPFEADITDIIEPGTEVRITVAVNNELTWQSIPPGVVEEMPDGQRRQTAIPRLLQLCRPPSRCLAVFDSGLAHRGRHSDYGQ